MTLPNFLGIGAMRSGTSWLYEQLRSHEQVYVSEQKELNFFNDFYGRGIEWYRRHFPSAGEAVKFKAIGEITPTYIADPEVPARIRVHIPESRFIAILRNPADRAFSEYTKTLRNLNFKGTFDEFLERSEGVLVRGYYTKQLERYFQIFSHEQFLILIFEEAVADCRTTIQRLSAFLEIDAKGFDLNRTKQKVNASYLPRMPKLYSSAVKTRQYLAKGNMGWVLRAANKTGLVQTGRSMFRFRGPRSELPKMDERTRKRLSGLYLTEIRNLESLLGRELSIWRKQHESSFRTLTSASKPSFPGI